MKAARSVVCLIVDRLRAAALGAYGGADVETPALDRLASESFVFDRALVDTLDPEAVASSLWTGVAGPLLTGPMLTGDGLEPTLAGRASKAGLATTLLTDVDGIAEHPLASDFDDVVRLADAWPTGAAASLEATRLARLIATAIERLDTIDGPHLFWIHAAGMAAPWDAPYAMRDALRDADDPAPPDGVAVPDERLPPDVDPDRRLGIVQSYAAQVEVLDRCVGALLDALDEHGVRREPTLFTLLSPRGIALGEHGAVGPAGDALYGEVVHVPWLLRFPDGSGALDRAANLVTPADLAPTLADWLGLEALPDRGGASLLPIVGGEETGPRETLLLFGAGAERAIRTPAWHLRVSRLADGVTPSDAPRPELYVKPDDRWETNDLAGRCHEVTAELTALLATMEAERAAGRITTPAPLAEILRIAPE